MLKRVAGIAVILGLLPFLGVACGEEATPTPTPSSTATPTPSPSGVLGEEPPEGWVVYQNEEHGFLFSYPEGWEQYSPEGISEEVEFFTGFRDSSLDDFQENIVVMVPPYGDMSLASMAEVLSGGFLPLGVLVSEAGTTVNGEAGHEWVLSWPSRGGFTMPGQKQRIVVLNTKSGWYQLMCSALAEQYDAFENTCQMMIDSFKVD